jgi:hypothetical protein
MPQTRRLLPLAPNDSAALSKRCGARYSGGQPFEAGSIMALPARFSLLHSDLNDFLFASVGEEHNGVTLSVVSALTRLGLDPWEQAARLTPLPKARAAEALATLIARLPIRRTLSSDDLAISQRLVELLPDQKSAPLQGRERVAAGQKKYWGAMIVLASVALGAAILSSLL